MKYFEAVRKAFNSTIRKEGKYIGMHSPPDKKTVKLVVLDEDLNQIKSWVGFIKQEWRVKWAKYPIIYRPLRVGDECDLQLVWQDNASNTIRCRVHSIIHIDPTTYFWTFEV